MSRCVARDRELVGAALLGVDVDIDELADDRMRTLAALALRFHALKLDVDAMLVSIAVASLAGCSFATPAVREAFEASVRRELEELRREGSKVDRCLVPSCGRATARELCSSCSGAMYAVVPSEVAA